MSVTLNDQMTIDHVIRVDADGTISNAVGVYAPEIYCDYDGPFSEASIMDSHESDMIESVKRQGWTLETGWTGQYSYSGAIMHPSEYIGGRMEEYIRETPGHWVALSVELHPSEDDPEYNNGSGESESAGWVLAYRPPGVNMDKSTTVHIHVGHNIPGYLPEGDVMCFDSVEGALEALRHEIKDQQDFYYESCEGHCPDCAEFEACGGSAHGETCAWCDTATDCEAALSAMADSGPDRHFVAEGRASWVFSPPEGADIHHWALSIVTDRADCEIFADQDY